jgi:predicted DNA-binding transcriptional regulator AlpA
MALKQCVSVHDNQSPTDKTLENRLRQFDDLPGSALVDSKLVCAICARSPSSIQRDVKAGRLATPIKIGPNAVRWRVGDIRIFLEGGSL